MQAIRRIVRTMGLAVLAAVLVASSAAAQATGRVTGIITDEASGRPIADVQVAVTGTRIGATTDAATPTASHPSGERLIARRAASPRGGTSGYNRPWR